MKLDYSWEAIVRPGDSNRFFDAHGGEGVDRPRFHAPAAGYSPVNAWWLSEMSRLIYVREADETGTGRSRSGILSSVNLREYCFINKPGLQCAIIISCDHVDIPFAVLVFRGTSAFDTWLSNLNTLQAGWGGAGLVHAGFKNEFCKIWDEAERRLSEIPLNFSVFYTGHSLGGAMAVLAASRRPPSAVYTFGAPKVGDAAFARSLRGVPIFRVVNNRDLVTSLPPSRIPFDFCHAGELCHYPNGSDQPSAGRDASPSVAGMTRRIGPAAYLKQRLMGPPEFLSDHAPVNYSLRLQQEICSHQSSPDASSA